MISSSERRSPDPIADSVEWPTIGLACLIYGGWLVLTLVSTRLPWWLLLAGGSWFTAWHMSLQHEIIHGHPTPWKRLNDAIGFPPLSLWLPYRRYEALHLAHHHSGRLTDPLDDPESYYVRPEAMQRGSRPWRFVRYAHNTLLGRLLIGPVLGSTGFLARELRLAGRRADLRRIWLWHGLGVAVLLAWLVLVCHLSLLTYAACFLYPGYALSLVRSFAEHRAARLRSHRTAIVENASVLGLLFLHNNLHVLHHARPGLAWFRLPAVYRAQRGALLRQNGGLVYDGYGDVARRYLLRAHDRPDYVFGASES